MADRRIAVITGAGRRGGIGAATALALARSGMDVFITTYTPYDVSVMNSQPDESDGLLAELRALGGRIERMEIDLAQPAAPPRLFDQVERTLGTVDVLINNATYSVNAGIDDLTAEIIDQHYAMNLRGMLLLCHEFAARWHKTSGGRIINLTSGQGLGAMPDVLPYIATKGAVDALTVSLSAALIGRGITVNAVDPGATDTGWMTPEFKARLIAQSPTGRVGQPEDAARLIAFLASEDAAWITGQIIRSRGGL